MNFVHTHTIYHGAVALPVMLVEQPSGPDLFVFFSEREARLGLLPRYSGSVVVPVKKDGEPVEADVKDAPDASTACKREPWCVRQVGHAGSCSPAFLSERRNP